MCKSLLSFLSVLAQDRESPTGNPSQTQPQTPDRPARMNKSCVVSLTGTLSRCGCVPPSSPAGLRPDANTTRESSRTDTQRDTETSLAQCADDPHHAQGYPCRYTLNALSSRGTTVSAQCI